MERVDYLFKSHLNYQLEAREAAEDQPEIKLDDIMHINLHSCTFKDFSECMNYARDKYPDLNFSDSSVESIKPNNYDPDSKYDFVKLADYAKHTAITIGNMALFSELQKITSAIGNLTVARSYEDKKLASVMSYEDYSGYDIKRQPSIAEEIGSCVIGGGNDGAIKITAHFHDSSTDNRPIISIIFYALNTGLYMTNQDIIDINNIYKPNATVIETFAYMSYKDFLNNQFNYSFDKLMISGLLDIDSLDDMYSNHYDLRLFDESN
ncbi:MAG: hypothetical protein IJ675_09190 [Pseudobutyrivibrio sp.]|nr:hypothetical protein [Pseudobutyrivibrio sp.]